MRAGPAGVGAGVRAGVKAGVRAGVGAGVVVVVFSRKSGIDPDCVVGVVGAGVGAGVRAGVGAGVKAGVGAGVKAGVGAGKARRRGLPCGLSVLQEAAVAPRLRRAVCGAVAAAGSSRSTAVA